MSARLATEPCNCNTLDESICTNRYVCGVGYYELTITLVAITAFIVLVLGWYGADLQSKKSSVVDEHTTRQKRASMARNTSTAAATTHSAILSAEASDASHDDQRHAVQHPPGVTTTGNRSTVSSSPSQAAFQRSLVGLSHADLRRKYVELLVHQCIRAFGGTAVLLVLAVFTPPVSTCLLPPCKVPAVVQSCVPLLVSFAVSAFVVVQHKFVHRLVFAVDYLVHPADRDPARWRILVKDPGFVSLPYTGSAASDDLEQPLSPAVSAQQS